jgi:hypothetical protein
MSTAYHPHVDGQIEREMIQTLGDNASSTCRWPWLGMERLPAITKVFAYHSYHQHWGHTMWGLVWTEGRIPVMLEQSEWPILDTRSSGRQRSLRPCNHPQDHRAYILDAQTTQSYMWTAMWASPMKDESPLQGAIRLSKLDDKQSALHRTI